MMNSSASINLTKVRYPHRTNKRGLLLEIPQFRNSL